MNRRIHALRRDYVDLVAWSAEAGHMTTYAAACRLAARALPPRRCDGALAAAGHARAGRARRDPVLQRRG